MGKRAALTCVSVAVQPASRRPNLPLLILGAALAVLGFVSTVLIGGALTHPGPASSASARVLVAARDLEARTTLTAEDLTTVGYSPADVPPGGLTKPAEAVGQVVQATIKKGQPVFAGQLGRASDVPVGQQGGYLPLPAGFVALTLPTGEQQGVAGYIQSGDYMDIEAITTPRPGVGANVRTVFANVHVIRVGPAGDLGAVGGVAPKGGGGVSSSLTVEVTQCQAEFLNWFVTNATLKYTLLSFKDYQATSAPDPGCSVAGSAKGITDADIRARWPGLI